MPKRVPAEHLNWLVTSFLFPATAQLLEYRQEFPLHHVVMVVVAVDYFVAALRQIAQPASL